MMEPKQTFKKNTYEYELRYYTKLKTKNSVIGVGIYKQTKTKIRWNGYEVILVREGKGYKTKEYEIKPGIIMPSNEEFGRYGWSFNRLNHALKKYVELGGQI